MLAYSPKQEEFSGLLYRRTVRIVLKAMYESLKAIFIGVVELDGDKVACISNIIIT